MLLHREARGIKKKRKLNLINNNSNICYNLIIWMLIKRFHDKESFNNKHHRMHVCYLYSTEPKILIYEKACLD